MWEVLPALKRGHFSKRVPWVKSPPGLLLVGAFGNFVSLLAFPFYSFERIKILGNKLKNNGQATKKIV